MKSVANDIQPGAFLSSISHSKYANLCENTFGRHVHAALYLSLYDYNRRFIHNNGGRVLISFSYDLI